LSEIQPASRQVVRALFERVIEMPRNAFVALYVLLMIVVIVGVDILFLKHFAWPRLIVNIAIVLVFTIIYFGLLKKR
jgi:hypothetical protein